MDCCWRVPVGSLVFDVCLGSFTLLVGFDVVSLGVCVWWFVFWYMLVAGCCGVVGV